MNLYGLFILGVNKYMLFSILYVHINVPVALKEIIIYIIAT